MSTEPLPLYGLYQRLLQQGLPLSVRDYLDALSALRGEFGLGTRERLLWLCQTLWARNGEERRRIALEFAAMRPPSEEDMRQWLDGETLPPAPIREPPIPHSRRRGPINRRDESTPNVAVDFKPANTDGLQVPAFDKVDSAGEVFIMKPHPRIPLRHLVLAWRRLRKIERFGPATELDLSATVADQCRGGRLIHLKRRSPRRNNAALTLLIDASPSMTPWRAQVDVMLEALKFSGLKDVAVRFFDNMPQDGVFETPSLFDPIPFEQFSRAREFSPLMIFSDGGSARGRRNRSRAKETTRFLAEASKVWPDLAWINPMPAARWRSTSFETVQRHHGVAAFPLTAENLIFAVDHLRGRRMG